MQGEGLVGWSETGGLELNAPRSVAHAAITHHRRRASRRGGLGTPLYGQRDSQDHMPLRQLSKGAWYDTRLGSNIGFNTRRPRSRGATPLFPRTAPPAALRVTQAPRFRWSRRRSPSPSCEATSSPAQCVMHSHPLLRKADGSKAAGDTSGGPFARRSSEWFPLPRSRPDPALCLRSTPSVNHGKASGVSRRDPVRNIRT